MEEKKKKLKFNKLICFICCALLLCFTTILLFKNINVSANNNDLSSNFDNNYFTTNVYSYNYKLANNSIIDFDFNGIDGYNSSFGFTTYTYGSSKNGYKYHFNYNNVTVATLMKSNQNNNIVLFNPNPIYGPFLTITFNDVLIPTNYFDNLNFNINNFLYDFNFTTANIEYQYNYVISVELINIIDSDNMNRSFNTYSYSYNSYITNGELTVDFDNIEYTPIYILTNTVTVSDLSNYYEYILYIPSLTIKCFSSNTELSTTFYLKERIPTFNNFITSSNADYYFRLDGFYNYTLTNIYNNVLGIETADSYYNGYIAGFDNGYIAGQGNTSPFKIITNTVENFLNLELFPNFRVYYILLIALGFSLFGLLVKFALGG